MWNHSYLTFVSDNSLGKRTTNSPNYQKAPYTNYERQQASTENVLYFLRSQSGRGMAYELPALRSQQHDAGRAIELTGK